MKSLIRPAPALLHDLYELPEPVVSVYFRMADPADDDVALRRRMIRHHLLRAATGSVALGAVENALSDVPRGPGTLAVFLGRDGAERRFDMPGADLVDRVGRAAVPDVVPFLRWWQYRPPFVVAVLDPAGAEISVRRSPWEPAVTTTVPGPDDVIEQAVAEALSGARAQLLVLVGDVRAVRFFRDKLPQWVRHTVAVETIPGGGGPDGSEGRRPQSLERTIHAMVDAQLRESVAKVIGQAGPGGLGVQGIPAVIHALAGGRIHRLLIGPSADTTAWFGPGPTDISDHRSTLPVPDAEKRHGPVADVLIRAATLTDAEVRILPLEMSERLHQGVGGICRYPD